MKDNLEAFGDRSKYGFWVWNSLVLKEAGTKSQKSQLKYTCEQNPEQVDSQSGDDMEIVEIS